MFSGCSSLTSITIPNSVTTIRHNALHDCTGLTSITMSNSVTTIEDGAFSGCSSLAGIAIPSSVTTIENEAFRDCSSLKDLFYLGESEPIIGPSAFSNCNLLTHVYVPLNYQQESFGGLLAIKGPTFTSTFIPSIFFAGSSQFTNSIEFTSTNTFTASDTFSNSNSFSDSMSLTILLPSYIYQENSITLSVTNIRSITFSQTCQYSNIIISSLSSKELYANLNPETYTGLK